MTERFIDMEGTSRPWRDRRMEEKAAAGGCSRRKLGVGRSKEE
jgi:hypothetical protein